MPTSEVACRQTDGSLVSVRHRLDFFTALQCMPEALVGVQPELGGGVEVEGRQLGIELMLTNLNIRGRNLNLSGGDGLATTDV